MAGETPAPRGVRWILFDAVGTLIDPDPPVAEVYHAAARHFGSPLSVDEVARRFRLALASEHSADASGGEPLSRPPTCESFERNRWCRIVGRVIDDVDQVDAESLFQQLWTHFAQPQHWRLYADVQAALSELTARGFRLGIASNFDGRLHQIVGGHPRLQTCEAVFVSSEVGFAKPDPRFFTTVTARLGVRADQILLVGDDPLNDVVAAKASGWHTVLLDRRLREPTPAAIHSLTSLSSIAVPDF